MKKIIVKITRKGQRTMQMTGLFSDTSAAIEMAMEMMDGQQCGFSAKVAK